MSGLRPLEDRFWEILKSEVGRVVGTGTAMRVAAPCRHGIPLRWRVVPFARERDHVETWTSKLGARRSWQPQTSTVGARSLSFPAFKYRTESGERLVGGHRCHFATGSASDRIQITGVLVVVAVQAKQLPIASVGRVVFVVVVSVVHRELVQIFKGKFARTTATDPGINLERLLSIALFAPLPVSSRLGDHPVQFVVIWLGHFANT